MIYVYFYTFINWFIKGYKVVISEAQFLPRDGRNHLWYSFHLPTEGWPGWVAWITTGMIDPPKVVTNPSTNRARRSVTSLMWRTPLPLRQTNRWWVNVRWCLCGIRPATYTLTQPVRGTGRGSLVGYSAAGPPLYNFAGDALQRTSQSVMVIARSGLRQILEESDSRRIFYFLCINLVRVLSVF